MLKSLLFDIGEVISDTDFATLNREFGLRIGVSPTLAGEYYQAHHDEHLLGKISQEEFFNTFVKAGASSELNLPAIWLEEAVKCTKLNQELLDKLKTLKQQGYILGALTNVTFTRKVIDEYFKLYDYFNFALLSCDEGLKKPDVEFYKLAVQKAGVKPEEMLFIDDKPSNMSPAEQLGMQTIVYEGNEKLIGELELRI